MATIVFEPLPEMGHILPTLHLARRLRARGHRIVYWLSEHAAGPVRDAGFAWAPVETSPRPPSARTANAAANDEELESLLDTWFACTSGDLSRQLQALEPDLLIGDHCQTMGLLAARDIGVPYIRCCTSLPASYRPNRIPLWCEALPGELSGAEIDWLWAAEAAHNVIFYDDEEVITRREYVEFAETCGIHPMEFDEMVSFAPSVLRNSPTLFLASRHFDFPNEQERDSVYAGPCLTPVRERWTYDSRREEAPLVLCSFGSQSLRYERLRALVPILLAAAKNLSHIDMVFAAPSEVFEGQEIPDNVHTPAWIPLRAALCDASAFITHGGHGSIKEALWEGVPMLVCPQAFDQHGNAARVAYHNLGQRIRLADAPSPASVASSIEALIGDERYREAATVMRQKLRDDESLGEAISLIESVVASRKSASDSEKTSEAARASEAYETFLGLFYGR